MRPENTARGLAICCLLMAAGSAHAKKVVTGVHPLIHTVSAGDTLWEISRSYGCELDALRKANGLSGNALDIGRHLQIPEKFPSKGQASLAALLPVNLTPHASPSKQPILVTRSERAVLRYQIGSGDTLGSIASRFHTTVDALMVRNRMADSTIFAGATLQVLPEDRLTGTSASGPQKKPKSLLVLGQSVGATNHGHLRKPSRLRPGRGYFIRRPNRTYGTAYTIAEVRSAIRNVRRAHPRLHRLAVGDISTRRGGELSRHASHQSGRDIDLGFYFKRRPKSYPQNFVDATAKNLNFEATWALLMEFAATRGKPGGVQRIFLSYPTQKILYRLARHHGVSKTKLATILQYPRGREAHNTLVWHEPGHTEHMHVRFACPANDVRCD